MKNNVLLPFTPMLALASVAILVQTSNAQFASSVISYNSGSGFQSGYNTPSSALGEPSRVTPGFFGGPVDPFNPPYLNSQIVSIGAGGWLTLQFNSPILNTAHAFGLDFNIFGNSGFIITNEFDLNAGTWVGTPRTDGSLFGADAISTRVSVSSDGINFFTLNPAFAPVVDSLFPTDGIGDFSQPVNPALTAASFAGLDLDAIRALYNGAGGGRGYDISWAQDSLGQSVSLSSVAFVRIDVLAGNAEIDGIVAVPEPSSLTVAIAGLATLLLRRKIA